MLQLAILRSSIYRQMNLPVAAVWNRFTNRLGVDPRAEHSYRVVGERRRLRRGIKTTWQGHAGKADSRRRIADNQEKQR